MKTHYTIYTTRHDTVAHAIRAWESVRELLGHGALIGPDAIGDDWGVADYEAAIVVAIEAYEEEDPFGSSAAVLVGDKLEHVTCSKNTEYRIWEDAETGEGVVEVRRSSDAPLASTGWCPEAAEILGFEVPQRYRWENSNTYEEGLDYSIRALQAKKDEVRRRAKKECMPAYDRGEWRDEPIVADLKEAEAEADRLREVGHDMLADLKKAHAEIERLREMLAPFLRETAAKLVAPGAE